MKYVLIIGDGMADTKLPALAGKTPLESLALPAFDRVAGCFAGRVLTVPHGMPAGSDTAILSIFGYAPQTYYTGRSVLEAAGMGVPLPDGGISLRINLCAVLPDDAGRLVIHSHNGGGIHGEEARALMNDLLMDSSFAAPLKEMNLSIYATDTFRHIGVIDTGVGRAGASQSGIADLPSLYLTEPHNVLMQPIQEHLPCVKLEATQYKQIGVKQLPVNAAYRTAGAPEGSVCPVGTAPQGASDPKVGTLKEFANASEAHDYQSEGSRPRPRYLANRARRGQAPALRWTPSIKHRLLSCLYWERAPSTKSTSCLSEERLPCMSLESADSEIAKLCQNITRLMLLSHEFLANHPINQQRIADGKLPANMLWPWGAATAVALPSFESMFGLRGAVISAVPLVWGIANLAGLDTPRVEGANGELNTNYEGKADAAVHALLRDGYDFAAVHVEAPDEMAHAGDLAGKMEAIQNVEKRVVARVLDKLTESGEDFRLMLISDHPTLLTTRMHDGGAVPFGIYDSRVLRAKVEGGEGAPKRKFCEEELGCESVIKDGTKLMGMLFEC